MKYMLDTDIASYASRGSHPSVDRQIAMLGPGDLCISVITLAEMLYGIEVSPRRDRDSVVVKGFLDYATVLEYPLAAAQDYAAVRAALKRQGLMIGPNDLFIAAHARHLGLTLVTNNTREYSRVAGLMVENWAVN